ncbi:MAG: methyltransferase domain-containing protein [Bacteroidia bacterium]|nr:methyltransferase domain-containing protein [Bacteroidia bacterium]
MSNSITKAKPVVLETDDKKEWFETWFDSPYYHILYKDRDHKEAELFLDNLITFLAPKPKSRILDVACGKGRHSLYLNKKGFNVTGYDLSEESISYDKQFENNELEFYLHDMREIFRSNYYDYVINLFSSFGYFEKERDNIRCLISHATSLKPNGIFVFDYFNCSKIVLSGEKQMEKVVDGIKFQIKKSIVENVVIKKIEFNDKGENFQFEERVMLFSKEILERFFQIAGLEIIHTFGNYDLQPFDENSSDRLILIAKKLSK